MADRREPGIHMLTFFDGTVEIFVGGVDLHDCTVRAVVTADRVQVDAVTFTQLDVRIVHNILQSLDVAKHDRTVLSWMYATIRRIGDSHVYPGNVKGPLIQRRGWPFDLPDEELLSSLKEERLPRPRARTLREEAERRGLVF